MWEVLTLGIIGLDLKVSANFIILDLWQGMQMYQKH